MSKDQKRGNREAKKPKAIKTVPSDPAPVKTVLGRLTAVKIKH